MRNVEGMGLPPKPAPRSMRWPLIIISLLGIHVVLMLTAAAIATHDGSFTVLPDYYRKAVHWDESRAAQRASDALGWKLAIDPATTINPLGGRAITLTLTDAQDRSIDGATVKLSCYHHAHASDPVAVTLKQTAPGKFESTLPMRYAGFWQFNITADAGGKRFISDTTQYVTTDAMK